MAANNPQKLKKIEQMLELNERKSKQKESNSEMKTSKIIYKIELIYLI